MRRGSDRDDGATARGGDMKAFPEGTINSGGMDLRDYFAAKAMQGMLANKGYIYGKTADEDDANGARRAYKIADAMMKARKTK